MSSQQSYAFEQNIQQHTDQIHFNQSFNNHQEQEKLKNAQKECFNSKIVLKSSTNSNQDLSTNSSTNQKTQSIQDDDDDDDDDLDLDLEFPFLHELKNEKEHEQVDFSSNDTSLDILSYAWNLAKKLEYQDSMVERDKFYKQLKFNKGNKSLDQHKKEGTQVHLYYEQIGKLLQEISLIELAELYYDMKNNLKIIQSIDDLYDINHQQIFQGLNQQQQQDISYAKELYKQLLKNKIFRNFNRMNEKVIRVCKIQLNELKWILFVYLQLHFHFKRLRQTTFEEKHKSENLCKYTDLIFSNAKKSEYQIIDFKYSKNEVDQILLNSYKGDEKDHFIDQIKAVQAQKSCQNVKLIIFPILNKQTSDRNYKQFSLQELIEHQQKYMK
ncbi:hypothetical protein ABPG74_011351 [Tetrahymena malaccensis]